MATWESLLKLPLDTLTRDRIDEVLADKKEDGSRGGTLLRVWGQFRHLLRDAGERELIPADLAVKLLRRPNALTGAKDGEHVRWLGQLDPDEPRKLSAALAAFETSSLGGGEFLRCAVRLSLATGMRVGEIVGLTTPRVDLRQGTSSRARRPRETGTGWCTSAPPPSLYSAAGARCARPSRSRT